MIRQEILSKESGGEWNEDDRQQQEPIGKHEGVRRLVDQPDRGVMIDPGDQDDGEA